MNSFPHGSGYMKTIQVSSGLARRFPIGLTLSLANKYLIVDTHSLLCVRECVNSVRY